MIHLTSRSDCYTSGTAYRLTPNLDDPQDGLTHATDPHGERWRMIPTDATCTVNGRACRVLFAYPRFTSVVWTDTGDVGRALTADIELAP